MPWSVRQAVLMVVLVALAVTGGFAGAACGRQDEGDGGGGGGASGGSGGAGYAGGQIDLKVKAFGVGSRLRPGDWNGVLVEFRNRSNTIRNVVLRLGVPDADGDTAQMERAVVPNPGVWQSTWLYARFPFSAVNGTSYTVTAYEATERDDPDSPARKIFAAGRLLGSVSQPLAQTVDSRAGMIGVVGRPAGLEQYVAARAGNNNDYAATGHELTEIVAGLTPADLPDRWLGLTPFGTLVWSAARPEEGRPGDLLESQAQALHEWVARGGHLVIVLPAAGQAWIGQKLFPELESLMPVVAVRHAEGVDLNRYRALVTNRPVPLFEKPGSLNFLETIPGAGPTDALPILAGPGGVAKGDGPGDVLASRRVVGAGMVTVVGLDLVNMPARMLEADIFWNRVLGKRLDILTKEEIANPRVMNPLSLPRNERYFERSIPDQITKAGSAAGGLFLAFIVFSLYWLAAGPLGYLLLKRRDLKHHAWVAFVGMAGVFTAVAWGGANALKPRKADAQHLTLLDHVYGQPNERARAWANVLLPSYGESRVGVGDPKGEGPDNPWHGALTAWDSPQSDLAGELTSFPDARGYPVSAANPGAIRFPARATAKQVQMDWAGPARWPMPHPVASDGSALAAGTPIGGEVRLVSDGTARGWDITGSLVHGLPSALTDVTVVIVRKQAELTLDPQVPPAVQLTKYATFYAVPEWAAGKVMDLHAVAGAGTGGGTNGGAGDKSADTYLGRLIGVNDNGLLNGRMRPDVPASTTDRVRDLNALSFFDVLAVPGRGGGAQGGIEAGLNIARRQGSHGYDLARWFTQPCLIIVGYLADDEAPFPVSVDGRVVPSAGRTVIRWVYPLGAEPPAYPRPVEGNERGVGKRRGRGGAEGDAECAEREERQNAEVADRAEVGGERSGGDQGLGIGEERGRSGLTPIPFPSFFASLWSLCVGFSFFSAFSASPPPLRVLFSFQLPE